MSATEAGGPARERRAARRASLYLGLATVAAIGAAVVYARGGQPQLEGVLLGAALAGIGCGLIVWARHVVPHQVDVEERQLDDGAEPELAEHELDPADVISRRATFRRLLGAAVAALAVALAFPVGSLGPRPGNALRRTGWRGGARLVDAEGRPVAADDVPVDGLVTVFPEGDVGAADGQAVLIRLPERLAAATRREGWSPRGFIAYSKVCTHAGCPVGLYEPEKRTLLCPCHQSAFDVLDGARPVIGPAARPLPQLRLVIDDDGYLAATEDFAEPVGPAWWSR